MNAPKILYCDRYSVSMTCAYIVDNTANDIVGFEAFTRKGMWRWEDRSPLVRFIERVEEEKSDLISYISEITEKDISNADLDYDFEHNITPSGSTIKPHIPVFQYRGPKWLGQLMETQVLQTVNGIVTEPPPFKDRELVSRSMNFRGATDKPLFEAGMRRLSSIRNSNFASFVALEDGWDGTSNLGLYWDGGVGLDKIGGTMAHSYVLSYETEMEAFRRWPGSTLLIDTYNTSKAIDKLADSDLDFSTVRIDSEPLSEMSEKAQQVLDAEVMISGSLTPEKLKEYTYDKAMAGTKYVGQDTGFVYKLVEVEGRPVSKNSRGKENYGGLKEVFVDGNIYVRPGFELRKTGDQEVVYEV